MKNLTVFTIIICGLLVFGSCTKECEASNKTTKKTTPKNTYSGWYIPQQSVTYLGGPDMSNNWVIVIVDTDFDLVPETAFIVKTEIYEELNERCGEDSLAIVCGIKNNIMIAECDTSFAINTTDDPDRKPVVTTIMGYVKKH